MNNKRPGEGLHILIEIIRKGIEYRIREYHAKKCAQEKHSWKPQPEGVNVTQCRHCPATTWKWPSVKSFKH